MKTIEAEQSSPRGGARVGYVYFAGYANNAEYDNKT